MSDNKTDQLDLESFVVGKLWGRLTLLQSHSEKEEIINTILDETQGINDKDRLKEEIGRITTPEERTQFVRNFLSYGIIEDLLCDSEVEDIIINSLKKSFPSRFAG